MPIAGYTPVGDGTIDFHRDDGTSFRMPATPDTVAEAYKLDGGAKPPEFYNALMAPAPMATSPGALAGPAMSVEPAPAGPPASVAGAPLPEPPQAGAVPVAGPALDGFGSFSTSKPLGQYLSERRAVQGEVPSASLAAAAERDRAAGITEKPRELSIFGPGSAGATPPAAPAAPAAIDPGMRLTLPAGGGSPGVSGSGGYARDPMLQKMFDRMQAGPQVIGRVARGYNSQGKVVESELGPGAEAFDDMARASEHVVGLKADLARKDADATQGKVVAQDQAVSRAEQAYQKTLDGFDAAERDIAARREQIDKESIDPGRFWTDQGAWGSLVGALSIMAGQIGAAMMKSDKNVALEVINRKVDQDIAAQVENLGNKRKALGDAERTFDLNIKRLGSLQAAIDYERLQKHVLVDAQLSKLELEAQADDEKGNLGLMRASNAQRISELAMGIDAKRNGTSKETYKHSQGGAIYAAGSNLTFDQQLKLMHADLEARKANTDAGRAAAQNAKDMREAGPQIAVYNGEQVALKVDKAEAEKVRKVIASGQQLATELKQFDEGNTLMSRLSPEGKAKREQMAKSIGAHLSTLDEMGVQSETERKEMNEALSSFLGGKGTTDAIRANIDSKSRAVLEQTAEGVVRGGRVVPLQGQRK